MRIVIDARMSDASGIGRYIRNLIVNLKLIDKKNEYIIFKPDIPWYGIKEQVRLPGLLKELRGDLVHFPHFNVPIFYKGKFVVTIHDLIHQHFSMQRSTTLNPFFYRIKQFGYKKVFKNAIEKSQRILVPSKFIKKSLCNEWKVDEDKVIVTYEAVDEEFLSIKTNKRINFDYLFYVGNAHPHKNIEGLIKAFLILRKKHKIKLVLAGKDNYFWTRVKKEYQYKDIVYAGQISDTQLKTYYENAKAYVMPSFEEGFGIPILEAMSCGCPVVSSNRGSLPEVGGDAALYFDPYDINDMVKKISSVLDDEKIRQKLIEKGLKRYKQFSWRKLAKKTLEVYKQSCT